MGPDSSLGGLAQLGPNWEHLTNTDWPQLGPSKQPSRGPVGAHLGMLAGGARVGLAPSIKKVRGLKVCLAPPTFAKCSKKWGPQGEF